MDFHSNASRKEVTWHSWGALILFFFSGSQSTRDRACAFHCLLDFVQLCERKNVWCPWGPVKPSYWQTMKVKGEPIWRKVQLGMDTCESHMYSLLCPHVEAKFFHLGSPNSISKTAFSNVCDPTPPRNFLMLVKLANHVINFLPNCSGSWLIIIIFLE